MHSAKCTLSFCSKINNFAKCLIDLEIVIYLIFLFQASMYVNCKTLKCKGLKSTFNNLGEKRCPYIMCTILIVAVSNLRIGDSNICL